MKLSPQHRHRLVHSRLGITLIPTKPAAFALFRRLSYCRKGRGLAPCGRVSQPSHSSTEHFELKLATPNPLAEMAEPALNSILHDIDQRKNIHRHVHLR